MSAESDSELSEFEVERNLFNKLKEKMKSVCMIYF